MDFTDIFNWVGDALGSLGGNLTSFLNSTFAVIANNFLGLSDFLSSLTSWIWSAFQTVVGWIGQFWAWLRDHIIARIIAIITAIEQRIRQWLDPLIQWIKIEQQFWYNFWNRYIKPLLDFIQRLRRSIQIFRLLGFRWAQQLDNYLARIESDIQQAFFGVWRNLNILSDWINFIVDPFGLMQPSMTVGSVVRSIGAIYGAIWAAQNLPLGASQLAAQQAEAQSYTAANVRQGLHIRALTGSQPEDFDNLSAVQLQWANLGIVA